MDKEDIAARIKEILIERLFLNVTPDAISPDDSLTNKYAVDSVRLFDMIVGLEDDFTITFEDEELSVKRFDTVNSIVERVCEKMSE